MSTYILPPESFPSEVRSSFYGFSAAMGKLGALVGGFCFGPLADAVCIVIELVVLWLLVVMLIMMMR